MRLFIILFSLLFVTASAAQASNVVYAEVNSEDPLECSATWAGLYPYYGFRSALLLRAEASGNTAKAPAAGEVIEFNPPLALGTRPSIIFVVKEYFPATTKPFIRVQYENGNCVTIPTSSFGTEQISDTGFVRYGLSQPFPNGSLAVKRIALVARGFYSGSPVVGSAQFIVPEFTVNTLEIHRQHQRRYSPTDPLLSFVYP